MIKATRWLQPPLMVGILSFALCLAIFISSGNVMAGKFTVVRVYDGDTLKAAGHDIEIKVRLAGIDSPETRRKKRAFDQPYSQNAQKFLSGMVLNKTVEIQGFGLGPYNRILGVVYIDGKNVNLALVKAGLAEVYQGKHPRGLDIGPYLEAQAEARQAERGIWSLKAQYLSPRQWRNNYKR